MPKCPAATKGESPPRQQTEKSEARITDLPAWFQQGKPHLIKPMTRWQRSTTAGRRVSCPDMPALKSSQFKSEFPQVLPLPSYGRGRTPPKMREIPARRTGGTICVPRVVHCTQVDEFSQSTLGPHVPKCPAATKGVPPPRQHTEKSDARTTTCRHGSSMASLTSLNQCRSGTV